MEFFFFGRTWGGYVIEVDVRGMSALLSRKVFKSILLRYTVRSKVIFYRVVISDYI